MSTTTPNLGLFKYNPETDGKETFSITTALNNNWDILDNVMSSTSSLGESGYMKFNNGLIINYGQASISSQEVTWERPNIKSNGTLGGDSFACAASTYANSYAPWQAFDGVITGSNGWEIMTVPQWITFYNPTPIKVSTLTVRNFINTGYSFKTGTIHASNDNTNWTQLTTWTNTVDTANYEWNIPVNSQDFYTYYRMTVNGFNYSYGLMEELKISAVYLTYAINDVTFPMAFTTTNYAYSLAYLNGVFGASCATTLTNTGMTLQNNSNADAVYYIAVGY